MGKHRSSNDDRSDSMNPNNPAYQASLNNFSIFQLQHEVLVNLEVS